MVIKESFRPFLTSEDLVKKQLLEEYFVKEQLYLKKKNQLKKKLKNKHCLFGLKNKIIFTKNTTLYYFFVKQQQKKFILDYKSKTYVNTGTSEFIVNILFFKFLKKKTKKYKKNLIFNFFKNCLKIFIEIANYKKMYKFNKKKNKLVFKPTFNLIKNKKTIIIFKQLKKKKKLLYKPKIYLKFFYLFLLNYMLVRNNVYLNPLFKKNKTAMFVNCLYLVLKSVNNFFF